MKNKESRLKFLLRPIYYQHIGSTPTFLYFDLYLNTACAAHFISFKLLSFNTLQV